MLDLGGFFTSPDFLTQIASLIVAILSTFFGALFDNFFSR